MMSTLTRNQKKFWTQKQKQSLGKHRTNKLVISKLISEYKVCPRVNSLLLCKHHLPVVSFVLLCRCMHVDGNTFSERNAMEEK